MSNKVFEFDTRQGSLKDRISGIFPVNAGAVITRTAKGRAARFTGVGGLNFGNIPACDFQVTDSFSILYWFRTSQSSFSVPVAQRGVPIDGWGFYVQDGLYPRMAIGTNSGWRGIAHTTHLHDGLWHQILATNTAAEMRQYADDQFLAVNTNAANTINYTGINFTIGSNAGNGALFIGEIARVCAWNGALTSDERDTEWYKFEHSWNIAASLWNRQQGIFCEDLLNEDADGVVYSAGQHTQNWYVASGNVRCLEDSIGKYLECTSDAVLQHKGIDLSVLTDNGTITEGEGYLSTTVGRTVSSVSGDASPLLSWATNILTLNMSTNDIFRKLAIKGA